MKKILQRRALREIEKMPRKHRLMGALKSHNEYFLAHENHFLIFIHYIYLCVSYICAKFCQLLLPQKKYLLVTDVHR